MQALETIAPWEGLVGAEEPRQFLAPEQWLEEADLNGVVPYDYQRDACIWWWNGVLNEGLESGLIVLPTGTGKTILSGLIIRYAWDVLGWRTLFLAHRDKLITQAIAALSDMGLGCVREQADDCARTAIAEAEDGLFRREIPVVVGSVQSLHKKRLKRWDPGFFGLLIRDEAHHVTAQGDQDILAHFKSARRLGVTATPQRLDGENLGKTYQKKVVEMLLPEAIGKGYLVPLRFTRADVEIDLKGINTRCGDLSAEELADRVQVNLNPIVNAVMEKVGTRKTIMFVPGVKCAQLAAEMFNQLAGRRIAEAVYGNHPDVDGIYEQFDKDQFQILVNDEIATEGFDQRDIEAVVLARATKSSAKITQMIGRGTRLSPKTGKTDCLVVDFAWQMDKHKSKIIRPYDLLLPPDMDPTIRSIVEDVLGGGEEDIQTAIKTAEEIHAERERRRLAKEAKKQREREEAERRKQQKALAWKQNPDFAWEDFCGIAPEDGNGYRPDEAHQRERRVDARRVLITQPQLNYLTTVFKVPEHEARSLTKETASKMINELKRRKDSGLATYRQVKTLRQAGRMSRDEALKVSFADASKIIDSLFRRGAAV